MYPVVKTFADFLKETSVSSADFWFRLNTKYTMALLAFFSVLVQTMELLRANIDCYTDDKDKKATLDNFCWTMGTFICSGSNQSELRNLQQCTQQNESEKIYQSYYQWIGLVLIIQAGFAYVPFFFWKIAENGLMKQLCDKLDEAHITAAWTEKRNNLLAYLNGRYVSYVHKVYSFRYIACKLLSIIMIVINMIILNLVIPRFWSYYPSAVFALISGNKTEWSQYSDLVFPKRAKCTFTAFGPSGSGQLHDALCLLPLNVLNEKVFAIIWCLFMVQIVASVLNFIYYVLIYYSKTLRLAVLRRNAIAAVSHQQVLTATNNGNFGDFFVLKQIARNINTSTFIDIMQELAMSKGNNKQPFES